MDGYLGRLQMVADNNNVSSRIRYMVKDIIELRQRHWRGRNADTKPPMTAQGFDRVPRGNLISVLGRRHRRVNNQGGSPLV
ncbi:hypothetical protein M407DRAFT_247092 [Tulasnella calospora MUT 4182]|uniref:MIF4G domain-containing protein n=1 Tax=Tulasnella calospora MUT 4182 TaxID=1051891 RepID=A0A0C3Q1G4_9AGAM|nr:hypothetical protein M407DRAFT_247092 [Tulasnella calospora MUT 4182]